MENQWEFIVNNEDSNEPEDWEVFVSDVSDDEYSDQVASDELRELMESLGWDEVAESYFEHTDFKNALKILKSKENFIQGNHEDE